MADLSHHLSYGTCVDYLTGMSLPDTDDERYRQKLARFLVEEKGYAKGDIEARRTIQTLFGGQFVTSTIDLVLSCNGHRFMILRYGPGSLVTRERPAIAAARVLDETCQLPLAVVTNGEDAELLDTGSRQVIGQGLAAIPSKAEACGRMHKLTFRTPLAMGAREKELRILNAFDVERCCVGGPCALPGAPEGEGQR
jgi:hypothetical protein